MLIVDGREGGVFVNPGREVEAAYRKLQREYVDLRHRLIENRDQESITADGVRIELLANVNSVIDAATAVGAGATGVGLFRTEYVFLTHPSVPTEEEQLAAYRAVIEASPNQTVTIRTLDLGGDKQVPYIGASARPIRSWAGAASHERRYPEFFQTQLRAILRAGVHGKISMLFPMVSTLEEVIRLKLLVENARQSLELEKIPHAKRRAVRRADRGSGRGRVHRPDPRRGRFHQHRLERPDPVPDGRRPRQSEGGPPVRAVPSGRVSAS